jgi:DNA helicase HerA-like ATPase
VYFVTQSPSDIPVDVLGQLGNRVQHALRAFTPRDQKAVKAAAETLRANPAVDAVRAIGELAVGEALVSPLDAKGIPVVTERAWMCPPMSQIGPITAAEREAVARASSALAAHYGQTVDRESAYEKLRARATPGEPVTTRGSLPNASTNPTASTSPRPGGTGSGNTISDLLFGSTGPRGGHRDGLIEAAAKSTFRTIGSSLGRAIIRGTLGSILGGSRSR